MKMSAVEDNSTQGMRLLRELFIGGNRIFNTYTASLVAQHLGISKTQLNKILSNLFKQKKIYRLRKGLYLSIGLLSEAGQVHPFVVSAYLVQPSAISHWSAAQYHELTEQLSSIITATTTKKFVTPSMRGKRSVTSEAKTKHGFNIDGIHYEYTTVPEKYYFGVERVWLDENYQINITDKERTLLDIFISPKLFGGMGEALGILENTLSNINLDKLIDYALQYKSKSLIKRLGWALEYFGVEAKQLKPLLKFPTTYYCRLDPALPAVGPCDKRWMIQNNLRQ